MTRCDACGGVVVRDVGQFVDRGRVRWSIEGSCRSCAVAWCEQGSGDRTPEEIRQALLAEHGSARLRLSDPGTAQVAVLRALRNARELTVTEAKSLAEELRATGLEGTLVEMEFVAARLAGFGVVSAVST